MTDNVLIRDYIVVATKDGRHEITRGEFSAMRAYYLARSRIGVG